jgi:hypothetical protein
MFYIKQKSLYWLIEERLYNGYINYINLPAPTSFSRNRQSVVFTAGTINFSVRRIDVVVPQGESLDSFLSALFNPSPDITGGGGGGNIEENEVQVSSGTYFVLATDKNIVCTGDCTIVLPLTTTGKFAFRIWAAAGVTATVKGTSPETINNETEFIIADNEMITVQNLLTNTNWALGH